jgi:hypothetical protein
MRARGGIPFVNPVIDAAAACTSFARSTRPWLSVLHNRNSSMKRNKMMHKMDIFDMK